jgi:hypothetical protein
MPMPTKINQKGLSAIYTAFLSFFLIATALMGFYYFANKNSFTSNADVLVTEKGIIKLLVDGPTTLGVGKTQQYTASFFPMDNWKTLKWRWNICGKQGQWYATSDYAHTIYSPVEAGTCKITVEAIKTYEPEQASSIAKSVKGYGEITVIAN